MLEAMKVRAMSVRERERGGALKRIVFRGAVKEVPGFRNAACGLI